MVVLRYGLKVSRVILPVSSQAAAMAAVHRESAPPPCELRQVSPDAFGTLPQRLTTYMSGEQVAFDDEVASSTWTPFQTRIWNATRLIPYGETRSYGWVSTTAGQPKACRAAGQSLNKNPVPIIVPCHRVVGADSSLTGFRSGLEMKRRLLSLEGSVPTRQTIL
ncbi:MAG: methylated-DNA--[protein]-cysteine S-methyltransferase [Dehalococcoidia bacterium]|nr:methylated-DNA--[protein]-cysteine S-methyltransferase [Dehalococcoidia bacterium]